MRQATWMGVYCTGGNEAANTLYKYFQVTMLQKRKKKNTFSFPTLEHLRVYVLSYIVTDMAHKTFAGYSPWDYEKVAILWRRSYRSMSPPIMCIAILSLLQSSQSCNIFAFQKAFHNGQGKVSFKVISYGIWALDIGQLYQLQSARFTGNFTHCAVMVSIITWPRVRRLHGLV